MLSAQLKAAAALLEKAAANRALLAAMSVEDRTRLLKAAGDIYCPDVAQRRRLVKARSNSARPRKQTRDQSKLHETGIRKLRREKVFTTPNVFPPPDFEQEEIRTIPISAKSSSRKTATSANRITRPSTISTTSFARRARN